MPTRACSQREAAVSLSLYSSVSGGCLPWLTLIVFGRTMKIALIIACALLAAVAWRANRYVAPLVRHLFRVLAR
jgi:hypothetical protein